MSMKPALIGMCLIANAAHADPGLTSTTFIPSGTSAVLTAYQSGFVGFECANMANARVRFRARLSHSSGAGPYYWSSAWAVYAYPEPHSKMWSWGSGALSPNDPDLLDVARAQFQWSCNAGASWSALQWLDHQWNYN